MKNFVYFCKIACDVLMTYQWYAMKLLICVCIKWVFPFNFQSFECRFWCWCVCKTADFVLFNRAWFGLFNLSYFSKVIKYFFFTVSNLYIVIFIFIVMRKQSPGCITFYNMNSEIRYKPVPGKWAINQSDDR